MVAAISAASVVTSSTARRAHPSLAAPTAAASCWRRPSAAATAVASAIAAIAVTVAVAPAPAVIGAAAPWAPGRSPSRTLSRLLAKAVVVPLGGSVVLRHLEVFVQVFD